MFATLLTIALFISPAIQGVLADLTISTPEFTQCQDAKITWDATTGPYNLIVVPSDDPCSSAVADLGDHAGTSMTYNVALPAGMSVELSLVDSVGGEAWSGTIVVGDSNDASCVPSALATSGTKSAVAASTSTSSTPSAPAPVPTTSSSAANISPQTTTTADTSNATPIGAANAGSNPLSSSAPAMRQLSAPIMAIATLLVVLGLSF